jgi:histidyl-tRNA synthetase
MSNELRDAALMAGTALRMGGYRVEVAFEIAKLGSMIKRAVKKNAKFAVIVGEEELNNECVIVKNLETGEQTNVQFVELIGYFDELLGKHEHHCHCHDGDCDCDCDCEDEEEHHCCCGRHKED